MSVSIMSVAAMAGLNRLNSTSLREVGHRSLASGRTIQRLGFQPQSLATPISQIYVKVHGCLSSSLSAAISEKPGRQISALVAHAARRQAWPDEPLVKGRMTNRAMLITKDLRMWWDGERDDAVLLGILERWVKGMSPKRKDWLYVRKDIDSKSERGLLCKISEWSLTQEWFEPNKRDYTKLIDSYGKAGRIEDAEKSLQDMERAGHTIDTVTLTVMMGLYAKVGMLERVIAVFHRMKSKGFEPDAKAYQALMIAYGYGGLPEQAEHLLQEMDAASVPANVETFCVLVNGYGRAEQPDEAQRVFDLMLSQGVKPNTKIYTALLGAYGKAGDPEKARAVFESLRSHGLVPDDRAICLLIAAYEKRDLVNHALGMMIELECVGVKAGSVPMTNLIAWLGRDGLINDAEMIFKEMVQRRLRITPQTCALMYKAYTRAGLLDKARDFTEDMRTKGIEFNVSNVMNLDPVSCVPSLA